MVENDKNAAADVFLHDRITGETTRVSVNSDGIQADCGSLYPTYAGSFEPVISASGRYMAFRSNATNLVSDDTNDQTDIFVHDRETGEITRMSIDTEGNQANYDSSEPSISADGEFIAFSVLLFKIVPKSGKEYLYHILRRERGLISVVFNVCGEVTDHMFRLFIDDRGFLVDLSHSALLFAPLWSVTLIRVDEADGMKQ